MAPVTRRPSALRVREYRIVWSGALLSNTGTWLQSLTVPYVLFQLTSSALWVGLAAVAQFLPMVALSPIGGVIADRYPRRLILLATQSAMALTALGLLAVWVSGVRSPEVLLILVGVGGALNGLNMPTWQSFVSDLVPREDLMSAVTLNSLQFNAARAIGPAVAGVILATLGAGWAFALNAASFLFVLVALAIVRGHQTPSPAQDQQGMVSQFRAAISYTRRQPFLLLVIAISGLVGALGNPIFGFTVVFAGVVYLVGPAALGLLNVAPGVGAIAAVPFLTRRTGSRVLSRTVAWALPTYGLAIMVFGAWPAYVVGMVALVVIGASFLAVISSVNSSLQLHVNDDFRGRVMALRLMAFTLSVSVGGLVQGWIADRVGPQPTVVGAGLVLLVIGLGLSRSRGTYRLSLLDGPRTAVSASV